MQRAQQEAGTVLAAAKAQAADLESQLEVGTLDPDWGTESLLYSQSSPTAMSSGLVALPQRSRSGHLADGHASCCECRHEHRWRLGQRGSMRYRTVYPELQAAQAALDAGQADSLARVKEAKAAQTAARAAQWADATADSDSSSDTEAAATTGSNDSESDGSGPLLAAADENAGGSMPTTVPHHVMAAAAELAATAAESSVATEHQPQGQSAAGSLADSGASETTAGAVHTSAPWKTSVPAAQQQQLAPEAAAEQDQPRSTAAAAAAAPAAEQQAEEAPQEKRWVWENGRRVLA